MLLEHSQTDPFRCSLWLLLDYNDRVELLQGTIWPAKAKILTLCFFKEEFAMPSFGTRLFNIVATGHMWPFIFKVLTVWWLPIGRGWEVVKGTEGQIYDDGRIFDFGW